MLDHGCKTGISMGVVSFSGSIPDIKHAMAYADRLMYQAKKAGKCKLIFEEVTGNSGSPIEHPELGITSNSSFG